MYKILLVAPNNSEEKSGESEVESELDTPRTELTSDSESSETIGISTRHNLFKALDTINKVSLHLRRAMVHTSPHVIYKQLFYLS